MNLDSAVWLAYWLILELTRLLLLTATAWQRTLRTEDHFTGCLSLSAGTDGKNLQEMLSLDACFYTVLM